MAQRIKKREKNLETNEIRSTVYQNLWNDAKGIIRGMFILISAYNKKKERSQINNSIYISIN